MGVDVGSVSTKLVLMDTEEHIINKVYLKTAGKPIDAIQEGLEELTNQVDIPDIEICGVGTTGSGRQLAGVLLGADMVKNEITAHAIAASKCVPDVATILEIGGQDSKLILLKDGVVRDFAMNTVCAAGTGSFLDRQAERLGIPIANFGQLALSAKAPVRIAGRCAVFAESDMIHKQQTGHTIENIVSGLCHAMVRNYLNNLAKGKTLHSPIIFQGGVAANVGMVDAFERELKEKIIVPKYYDVMGAYGAALLAKAQIEKTNKESQFRGFTALNAAYRTVSITCSGCSNQCEIICVMKGDTEIARWGGRCDKATDAIAN